MIRGRPLLNEFDTLKNILSHAGRIKKPAVRDSIIRNAEKLKINYKLIKLDDHMSVPFRLQELEYAYSGITTNEVLKGIGLNP